MRFPSAPSPPNSTHLSQYTNYLLIEYYLVYLDVRTDLGHEDVRAPGTQRLTECLVGKWKDLTK